LSARASFPGVVCHAAHNRKQDCHESRWEEEKKKKERKKKENRRKARNICRFVGDFEILAARTRHSVPFYE